MKRETSWSRTTLGVALPIRYGKARTDKAGVVREESPVYGSSGVIGKFNRALTNGPTLIVGRKGTVGATHYSAEPCWPIDTVYFTEASEDKDLRFFKYLLDHLQLGKMDRSTAVPGLSRDDYNAKEVFVPSLDEQRRIVAEIEKQFTRLETGVAALQSIQAKLKRYRAAILKAACEGRLVPTEAELARKENRSYESAEILLQRILKQRREKWNGKGNYKEPVTPRTAELPSLPEGWTWASFDQITSLITKGSSPNWQGFKYCDDGITFVRSENVRWGTLDLSNVAHLPPAFNEKERKSILRNGDVLLNLVGASIGRAAIATPEVEGGNVNQAVAVIRLVNKETINRFATLWLNSSDAQKRIHAEKVEVARANFSLEDTRVLPIPLPPLLEQERIVAEVERRLSVVEELEALVSATLQRATRLRQSILQRAFSSGATEKA